LVVPRNEKENLILELVTSLLLTSTTGGDETDLLARNVVATGSGWVTNVLMVTTSVRVLDRVHGTTTDLRPRVPLDAVLVVGTTSLKERLVETTATGDDTDGGTTGVLDPLLGAGWETELGAGTVDILGDEGAVVAGGAGDDATVTRADLKVGDDGTLREGGHWESVASNELGLLSAVDELTLVETLDGWHELLVELVGTSIVEVNLGEWGATAGVMNDVLDDTLHEAIALAEIENAKLGSSLPVAVVGFEDGSTTLTLSANDTTHGCDC